MAYYVYSQKNINGVDLKILKSSPKNIQLTYLGGKSVSNGSKIGINGGFFQDLKSGMKFPQPYVYSIAVNNNVPINGTFDTYGSGGTQDVERGTLVWNDTTRAYFIQQTKKGDQSTLWVGWNDKYWAQGGISMSLQDDNGWYNKAKKEGQPYIDEKWYRSGLLYNNGLNIFLVVSTSECTSAAFRTACKGIESNMVDGIFLDGANAAQMKCSEFHTTHTRPLSAMIEIVNNVSL